MDYNNYNTSGGHSNNNYGPYDNSGGNRNNEDVVSIGTWIGLLIITAIPIVNIIALFVMAFGSSNQNIKNYGKAALIIAGVSILLGLLAAACQAI